MNMKVLIKGKEVQLKRSFRSLIAYEQIVGEAFSPKNLTQIITYFYCVIISSNSGNESIGFDEFIDFLDDNPTLLNEFTEFLREEAKENEKFNNDKTKKKESKKN